MSSAHVVIGPHNFADSASARLRGITSLLFSLEEPIADRGEDETPAYQAARPRSVVSGCPCGPRWNDGGIERSSRTGGGCGGFWSGSSPCRMHEPGKVGNCLRIPNTIGNLSFTNHE